MLSKKEVIKKVTLLISDFYYIKNYNVNLDKEEVLNKYEKDLLELRIHDIDIKDPFTIEIILGRPDLLIGPRGENIEKLTNFLIEKFQSTKIEIHLKEKSLDDLYYHLYAYDFIKELNGLYDMYDNETINEFAEAYKKD